MKKNNKIVIILVPAFVLFMGYIIWKDYWPKNSSTNERKVDDNVFDVRVDKRDSLPKKGSEVYKKKWQREAELSRKVENPDNFFAEEIKKDPVTEKKKTEEFIEPVPVKKEESKVVVVYRERPVRSQPVKVDSVKIKPKEKRFMSGDLFKGNIGKENSAAKADPNKVPISVTAVIQYDQKVINGSDITIRLTQDLVLPTTTIPRNTFVSGRITFGDQRATIVVSNVVKNNTSYVVALKAFAAADGVEGIAIPSATNQSISNDVQNALVQEATRKITSPILSRSTSSAGNRKVNEQSVNVPSGYELILKN